MKIFRTRGLFTIIKIFSTLFGQIWPKNNHFLKVKTWLPDEFEYVEFDGDVFYLFIYLFIFWSENTLLGQI